MRDMWYVFEGRDCKIAQFRASYVLDIEHSSGGFRVITKLNPVFLSKTDYCAPYLSEVRVKW